MLDLDYFRSVFHALLRAKIIDQVHMLFTLELLQLCDYPMPQTAVRYSMAPNYESTLTHRAIL